MRTLPPDHPAEFAENELLGEVTPSPKQLFFWGQTPPI